MNVTHWKKRPFIYATIISVGFWLLTSLIQNLPDQFFQIGSIILFGILLFELFSTKFYAEKLLDQFQLPHVEPKDRLIHNIHHKILPSMLYWSLVIFVYFNHQHSIVPPFIVGTFFIFGILFTNIRAYYEDKFKLEQQTHNVYDILIMLVMFIMTDAYLNLFGYLGSEMLISSLMIVATFVVLCIITLIRYQFRLKEYPEILTPWTFLAISQILVIRSVNFSSLATSLLFLLLFYFFVAVAHHIKDSSLNWKVISEYIVVFFIFIVLLYGVA